MKWMFKAQNATELEEGEGALFSRLKLINCPLVTVLEVKSFMRARTFFKQDYNFVQRPWAEVFNPVFMLT